MINGIVFSSTEFAVANSAALPQQATYLYGQIHGVVSASIAFGRPPKASAAEPLVRECPNTPKENVFTVLKIVL